MYRCEVCRTTQPPRTPKRKHLVCYPNGQIAREVAVCEGCQVELARGKSLAQVANGSQVDKVIKAVRS